MIGIYKIENLVNGKIYIGQSCNLTARIAEHKLSSRYNNPNKAEYNYPLSRALRKYGLKNFSFKIIEYCELSELDEKEKYWINYYDSYKNGYNGTLGGKTGPNYKEFPVYQYDLFGNFINEYSNIYEAAYKNNIFIGHLRNVLKEKPRHKTAKHYQWKKEKYDKIDSIFPKIEITCFSLKGEKIIDYSSFEEAEYYSGDKRREIKGCCEKQLTSTHNFQWRYSKEVQNIFKIADVSKGIKISQYDNHFNLLNEYSSAAEAERLTKICSTTIRDCCAGKRKTAGGFIWADSSFKIEELVKRYDKYNNVIIVQCDLNNNILATYENAAEAARQVFNNVNCRKSISKCCQNQNKTYGGYIWRYDKKYKKM